MTGTKNMKRWMDDRKIEARERCQLIERAKTLGIPANPDGGMANTNQVRVDLATFRRLLDAVETQTVA